MNNSTPRSPRLAGPRPPLNYKLDICAQEERERRREEGNLKISEAGKRDFLFK